LTDIDGFLGWVLELHGGMKVYRGSAAAARNYVEAGRSRVDDYYLAEGTGLAERYVASSRRGELGGEVTVGAAGSLGGDAYEAWVAGYDVNSGVAKGRLRTDEQGVRFVEVVVNGPKTWSLAAALHPEVATAYDAAQERAASEIIGWLAGHATTRVGPRGRQVQVPVEQIEAAVVRHYTSRAGDPHRHLHLQVNARVRAAGRWRGLHTVGVRDSLDAINGIGHAAVACDPEFRRVLAAHGYTVDPASGEVAELAGYAGAFSARAAQIGRNVDRYEAEWRAEHPGEEPGRRLRRAWDTRAWAEARPDKVVPTDGAELSRRWVEELHDLGYRPPTRAVPAAVARIGALDRAAAVETILTRLGARRSAWNVADIRGEA
jgi:conjugative relaxase-like TrwC/TraI family protein